MAIQHRAGWTSTNQLKTYDLSTQQDSFKQELAKRGLIESNEYKDLLPKTKECICGQIIGFTDRICPGCKRMTDTKEIKRALRAEEQILAVFNCAMENSEMRFLDILKLAKKRQDFEPSENPLIMP